MKSRFFLVSLFVFIILMNVSFISPVFPKITSNKVVTQNINYTANYSNFTQLLDTPSSYAGAGGFCVKVNSGATALEFVSCPTGITWANAINGTLLNYSDALNGTLALNSSLAAYVKTVNWNATNTSYRAIINHTFYNGTNVFFGINTSTPQNQLNVVGDINATTTVWSYGLNLTTGYGYALNDSLWTLNYSTYLTKPTWAEVNNGTMASWANAVNGTLRLTTNTSFYNSTSLWSGFNLTAPQNALNIRGGLNVTNVSLFPSFFVNETNGNTTIGSGTNNISMWFNGTGLCIGGC